MMYEYKESGLKDVYIEADVKDGVVTIDSIGEKHKAISNDIINQKEALRGDQIKFLRSEMGMTQEILGNLLNIDVQTIKDIEDGKIEMDYMNGVIIRCMGKIKLK